jgi:glucose/arabinose dehydrogenase
MSTMRRAVLLGALLAVALAGPAAAQSGGARLRLVKVGNFASPLYAVSPPGDPSRVMVVERSGRIWVVRHGRRLARPFLDIRPLVVGAGEQGLLSVAFPPDYARSRRFYVYYTEQNTANNKVVEYRRSATNPDRADPSTARVVLSMPDQESNHNGGLMLFRPDERMYIGTGDGGGANDQHPPGGNGQNLGSLLGKILRIDPRASGGQPYTIPRTNPFVGRAGARGEIYAYGLRNPWRFSFDRATGDLAIGDVGQGKIEEIDFMRHGTAGGANFGWRPWEGRTRLFPAEAAPGAIFPVIEHSHASGFCSIIGGYVVRDAGLPALRGRYLYSDLCDGRVWATRLRTGTAPVGAPLRLPKVEQVSSFGEDASGRVYVMSILGAVYRIAAAR